MTLESHRRHLVQSLIYPVPEPHPPLVVNTMWPLDEFTAALEADEKRRRLESASVGAS